MNANLDDVNHTELPGAQRATWLIIVRVLLGIAVLGAVYLAWVSIANGPVAGCGPGSACDKVLQSRWAYWLQVPVSVPAVLVYGALLGATLLAGKRMSPDEERGAWAAIIALSVIVAGAAAWFVGLQVFVLKAFCQFCMAAHGCGFAAALLCLTNIPLASDPETPMWSSAPEKRGVPRAGVLVLAAVGLAGVAVLAAGQMLVQKQRNVVQLLPARAGGATNGTAGEASANGAHSKPSVSGGQSAIRLPSPNARLLAPELLSLYDNQFLIPLDDVPMTGAPGASNVIVYLFDYTCTHCRELHNILLAAQKQFSNRLGIVSLPAPISTNCNPLIPAHFSANPDACAYAQLGLALWRIDREAHRQFDELFFGSDRRLSVEQARNHAVQWVGADALERALADPWVEQQIAMNCQIHFANWEATGRAAMPQLILGQAVSIGPLNSVEHLLALLQRYLGLHPGVNPPGGYGTTTR